ncbi:DNA polymerase IV [Desulfomicrobium baculatum]|uniref:DNA polymerase IV n=1 Tax=Desulfomicrobium baculatum (strain DSM 4028 / VKM B-1378 / X) TaxID=525897 RepID=C7LWM3_DESBD|nr:DNA polymerase IV [Desulfomicrobium baculatum]ACU89906.1 DNA-directed DNA polymerase [Desulfomicrobium baculatum DSM 4028]
MDESLRAVPDFKRVILHLDMDAFFTSVEQADDPLLQGKPVVIGQSLRGVASAASYEARKYGIRSAMPIVQAKKLCPHAVFLPGRMSRYREISVKIMNIMRALCPLVEQASVDEAYADISGTRRIFGPPENIARRLKAEILAATNLTCSVGIAPNKFLAKIASDWNKPGGLTFIPPADVPAFLRDLPLGRIPGVGKQFQEELRRIGVTTIPHVLAHPRTYWNELMGKRGAFLHDRACGIDDSPVVPGSDPKSCSAENTLDRDTLDRTLLERWLLIQAERIGRELRGLGKKGLTVTLKIKFQDFSSITRSRTLARPTDITTEIFEAARMLLTAEKLPRPVRLIGTGVSNFRFVQAELPLMPDAGRKRSQQLDQAMDRIRDKFGNKSILRAEAAIRESDAVNDLLSQKNRTSNGQ